MGCQRTIRLARRWIRDHQKPFCKNCGMDIIDHANGRCLFASTTYARSAVPWITRMFQQAQAKTKRLLPTTRAVAKSTHLGRQTTP